jgi:hypothetical protein
MPEQRPGLRYVRSDLARITGEEEAVVAAGLLSARAKAAGSSSYGGMLSSEGLLDQSAARNTVRKSPHEKEPDKRSLGKPSTERDEALSFLW